MMELTILTVLTKFVDDLALFASVSALFGLLYCIFRAFFNPLRDIPGPISARFSRLWYVKHINKGQQELDERELHRRYGPIVRLTPNQYSFDDLSAAKAIYDHGSKFAKSDFYAPFGPPVATHANLFQEQDNQAHALKRRRVATLYSLTSILSYEPFVDDCIDTFLEKLDEFSTQSKSINLAAWMQFYAFDVIGAISIGEPYGFLQKGYDFPGIIAELHKAQAYGIHVGTFAGSWHKYIATVTSYLVKTVPFQATHDYTVAGIKKKKLDIENGKILEETTAGRQDFTDKIFASMAKGKLEEDDLLTVIRTNNAAGSDTTGISLSMLMHHLISNPEAFSKLRQEVDEHKVKQDESKTVTFAQAQEMPYLQAVIKEALRLHPAVGMQLPRVVPKDGAMLAGRFFPAGTVVGINPWVIHHNPQAFGSDASQFRPERWLEAESKVREMDRNLFTFGAGSRTCIGKHISMLEMQKLVPELVARYDFELMDKERKVETLNRFFVYANYECLVKRRHLS